MEIPPPAGVKHTADGESAAACLRLQDRPTTPEKLAKWRKSSSSQAGQRVVHPGVADDLARLDLDSRIFGGALASTSEHVVFRHPGVGSDAERIKLERSEAVYRMKKRMPLGRSYVRGHQLPERTEDPSFRFGMGGEKPDGTGKDVIPEMADETSEEAHALYVRSHGSYLPGEQKRRNYRWPKPVADMVFPGERSDVALNGASEGVKRALQDEGEFRHSRIALKRVEDFKATSDVLGRARNLGMGARPHLPADHVFGKGSRRRSADEWDAKACMEGSYSEAEQQPDADLGRSITPGFRNMTSETRAFGTPTIRSDIPRYGRRSIADDQNYGDDVSAQYLLCPGQFASLGVEDADFVEPRPKQEVKEIFTVIGYDVSDGVFDELWARAVSSHPSGMASLDGYRRELNAHLAAQSS